MDNSILYYVHDPMCSWCWGFKKTWLEVQEKLPDSLIVKDILGGLAPDNDQPMPDDMQISIRDTWRSIQKQIPGTEFNFDFWTLCKPRRSTYPACRAVIAARHQHHDAEMVTAIQQAYYLDAKNPSDDDVLIYLAEKLGLDRRQFTMDLNSADTKIELQKEIALGRSLGVYSYPTLLLSVNNKLKPITIDYTRSAFILDQLAELENR